MPRGSTGRFAQAELSAAGNVGHFADLAEGPCDAEKCLRQHQAPKIDAGGGDGERKEDEGESDGLHGREEFLSEGGDSGVRHEKDALAARLMFRKLMAFGVYGKFPLSTFCPTISGAFGNEGSVNYSELKHHFSVSGIRQ